jgi:hypothetical protein
VLVGDSIIIRSLGYANETIVIPPISTPELLSGYRTDAAGRCHHAEEVRVFLTPPSATSKAFLARTCPLSAAAPPLITSM